MSKLIVTIEEGQVRGKKCRNFLGGRFCSFLGIPYAEPPVGNLRFRAPLPKKPWKGIRNATKEGPPCPSPHMFFQFYVGAEDNCLNLNVYTRALPGGGNPLKPVMVWIHGGAFVMGFNKGEIYGPEFLMSEDVVLVAINYRLGVLGFLSLEDPSLGVPGNAGMKDMVLALKWVQKNIKQFNGDPRNVTIFGESAGSAAVTYLCLSPMGKGLFHKAIAQSGNALNCWALGQRNGTIVADCLKIRDTNEKNILEKLRRMSAKKLVKYQFKAMLDSLMTPDCVSVFGPVVEVPSSEPSFLAEQPIVILKKGTFNKVPMIIGYNSQEGFLYQLLMNLKKAAREHKDLERDIPLDLNLQKGSDKSIEVAKKIKQFYFGDEEITRKNRKKLLFLKTDNHFLHGIYRSISYQKSSSDTPIYFYKMTVDTKLNLSKEICTAKCPICFMLCLLTSYKCGRPCCACCRFLVPKHKIEGVAHGDDVSYLFKSFVTPKMKRNSVEEISVKRFVKLWTNFAKTGNPTPVKSNLIDVLWRPVNRTANFCLEIGRDLKMIQDPDSDRMKFWNGLYSSEEKNSIVSTA
jgi:carboxylesterase type B